MTTAVRRRPDRRAVTPADATALVRQLVDHVINGGDTVVARLRCTGTQLADWDGLPATGRTMHVDEVQIFHFADGHIAHVWALEDTWARRRQLIGEDTTADDLGALG